MEPVKIAEYLFNPAEVSIGAVVNELARCWLCYKLTTTFDGRSYTGKLLVRYLPSIVDIHGIETACDITFDVFDAPAVGWW